MFNIHFKTAPPSDKLLRTAFTLNLAETGFVLVSLVTLGFSLSISDGQSSTHSLTHLLDVSA